jgi:hypothetical protein
MTFVAADMVTTKTVVLSTFQFKRTFKLIENFMFGVSYAHINFARKISLLQAMEAHRVARV